MGFAWFSEALNQWWIAVHAGDFRAAFGNELTIGALSCVLVVWAIIAGRRFKRGTQKLRKALADALNVLKQTPAEARVFSEHYETISTRFDDWPVFGPAWRDWRATLITPVETMVPIRSTLRPADYLSMSLLRSCGINPRLHAATPNLLVGVGLLLTFLGLSLALSGAGSIVGAERVAREVALQSLLNTASAKFILSLAGLACSISLTIWRSWYLQTADQALDAFLAALEERIPLATAAGMQSETNAMLVRLLNSQELFSNQLAVSIGTRLDEAFDNRLSEHIGPLRESIDRLAENLGTKSEDAIQEMMRHFVEHLHGGSNDAMKEAAKTLGDLRGAMEDVRSGLMDAAERMAQAASQMADRMGRSADEAMARIGQQMEALVSQLRGLADATRDAGSEALQQAAGQISAAGEGLTNSARHLAETLGQAIEGIGRRMGSEAETATRQMAAELSAATDALRQVAESSRDAGDAATRQLADRIAEAANNFQQTASNVAASLSGGADDATTRLAAAMEEMRSQFGRLADEMGTSLRDAGGAMIESSRSGAGELTAAAIAAAEALRSGGQDGGEAVRAGGSDAARAFEASGEVLGRPAGEMARSLTALQAEAAALSSAVGSMRDAANAAAAPLVESASNLAEAGRATKEATNELAEVGRRMPPLAEALVGTAARLQQVEERISTLSRSLDDSTARFAGLDTAMALAFRELESGLDGFSKQVSRFLTQTNEDMAKATTALNASVEGLTEALEDYAQPQARGR